MRPSEPARTYAMYWSMSLLVIAMVITMDARSGVPNGPSALRHLTLKELEGILPSGTLLMMRPAAIEAFLSELDGEPPDWTAVYGRGHHDPDHDDRLFALNRERDAKRERNPALSKQIAFTWTGTLSRYDPARGGFPVALGPNFIKTKWGIVRFKPEEIIVRK